jgi:hypothetical protein
MPKLKTIAFATCIGGFSLLANVLSSHPVKAGYCKCEFQGYHNGAPMYFCCNDYGNCFYHRGSNYPLNC